MNLKLNPMIFVVLLVVFVFVAPMVVLGQTWWFPSTPDFVINETADFDAGVKINITTVTDRYNITDNEIQLDFPYASKDADLVSYWRFSDATVLTVDETGTNDASANTADFTAAGKFGGAFDFDGTEKITIPNSVSLNPNHITLSVWFYGTSDDFATQRALIHKPYTSAREPYYQYQMTVYNTGTYPKAILPSMSIGGTRYYVLAKNTGWEYGQWNHAVATYDGETMKVYVNGVYIAQNTAPSGNLDSYTTALTIGENAVTGTGQMLGKIDEVKIYDTALDLAEIQELYNNGKQYIDTTQLTVTSEWHSDAMTVPVGKELKNISVNVTQASATCYMDYIIVVNSTNSIKYFNDTDVQSAQVITYTNSSSSYNFGWINDTETWNITIGFEGDGTCTATLEDIIGFYDTAYIPPESYTSLYAVEFDVNDTTFSSTDYTTIFIEEFNTTTYEAIGIMTSFNLEKLTGGGTSVITGRIYADGTLINAFGTDETLRTISANSQPGVTGFYPILTLLTAGEHNISMELARTGNGDIEISNIDFVLGKFNTTSNALVRGQLENNSFTVSSDVWSETYNWTVDKAAFTDSPTYYGGKFNIQTTAHDHIWLNFTNWNTSETSSNALRHISGATEVGSIGINWINANESGDHNMTIGAKTDERFAETVTVTGTSLDFDLRDLNDGDLINHFQSTNDSISEETPMSITDTDYQLIDSELIRLRNGTGLFISSFISFNSSSDAQSVSFKINVSNATCADANKERYLADNDDMGNAYFYYICDGTLDIEQNYTVSLWGNAGVDTPVTETMLISSASLNAMEVTYFNLSALPTAPTIQIQSPTDTEPDNDVWFNVTTNQDNTDECWYNIDGNTTYDWEMTNATGNWYNQTTIEDGIHYVTVTCNNTDGYEGSSDDFYFFVGEGDLTQGSFIVILILLAVVMSYLYYQNKGNDMMGMVSYTFLLMAIVFSIAALYVMLQLSTDADMVSILGGYLTILISFMSIFLFALFGYGIKHSLELWQKKKGGFKNG